MIPESNRCHDPEVLSAFVAGNLSDEELKMTVAHLLTCEDCRFIVGEAARAGRKAGVVESGRRRIYPWWLAAAAAVLLGIFYIGVQWTRHSGETSRIAIMVDAAPRDGRDVEPRLSGGFHWAPLRPIQRDSVQPLNSGQMKLVGAAGVVLEKTANDPSPRAQHDAAIAHLVAGRAREAARLLAIVARSNPDPQTWSDLAAARYTLAAQTGDAGQLGGALAASDAALHINPKSTEALFNRALIVERLGLRQQARTAWERYLEVDPKSAWAIEAQQHLKSLSPAASFKDELERQYAQLVTNPVQARALAARFPQDARVRGETEILGNWAEAVKRADFVDAERHLRVARSFGEELATSSGETMLQAAARAVEEVSAAHRTVLADAHVQFRTAQLTFKAGRHAEAERDFTQAAAGFEFARSPAALLARYFAANTLYEQGKIEEARSRLETLLAAAPPSFPAYRAQLKWELGLIYGSRGEWGRSISALKDSIAAFEHLRETGYASSVREILAQVYDRVGDPHAAWHHRMLALQELGRSEDMRLESAMFASAGAAAANRDWPVSVALLGLQLEMARNGGDELIYVETLLLRASVHGRLGQPAAARGDLAEATSAITNLHDATSVERAGIDLRAVEAGVETSPGAAVTLLRNAIDFHRAKGRRMFLPELFLKRGRALIALGRLTEAAADFDAGISELEAQRLTLEKGEQRWGMFAEADELFDEALALALSRGDKAGAFAYSERARARELLESLGPREPRAVPAVLHGAVIEYAALPAELVIFVGDGVEVQTIQEPIGRAALVDEVERFTHGVAVGNRAEFEHASSRLYARLITPIAASIRPGTPLVFVPDATLRDVSFAALTDSSGHYLVEEHTIVVAPSAAVHEALASRHIEPKNDLRLLLVAGAKAREGELGYLSGADREAMAIQACYRQVDRTALRDDRRDAFTTSAAAAADVIHFVGHASVDDFGGAALLTSGGAAGSDHRLDVRKIASSRLGQTRVVVLAACSTAEGEERAREGSISLARAFMAAGVPSVIATLWPIDDRAAAGFFPRLHSHLARGIPPAEALRLAQLESIHSHEASPFMWAAVQTIGS